MDDDNLKSEQAQSGGENSAAGQGQAGQATPDGQGKEPDKTFTQAELNVIIQDRLAAERKKMPSKDELQAFKAWQAEQKKDEPVNEEAEAARRELAATRAELTRLKNRDTVIQAGVPTQYADFVAYETSKLTDDDTDFATALQTFMAANEQYKAEAQPPPVTGASGMRHGQAPQKMDGVEEEFLKLNPNLKKPK